MFLSQNLTKKLKIMNKSTNVEYLEKYSVAPSPSRDYYGIKVLRDQITLYTWKISHGPHTNPIVRVSRFCDFGQEKTMHNEIQRVFGEPIFRHVQSIARGNEKSLLTLPQQVIKKLAAYLTFKDVSKLSTLSHVAKEVFDGDIVWEVLYRRQKMGLVYGDEREQGSSRGWKRFFEERQMHKPARSRKARKVSGGPRPVTPRSSITYTKRPSSSLTSKKNKDGIASAVKSVGPEVRTPKFVGLKSNRHSNSRSDTASEKKSDADIKGCKLLSGRTVKGDDDLFVKKTLEVKRPEKSDEDLSTILKSRSVQGTKEERGGKGVSENKAKSKTMPKTSLIEINSDKTSAVSVIGGGKNSGGGSRSSLKKFTNLGKKSNPPCSRGIESKAASRFGWTTFKNDGKKKEGPKSSGRSEICRSEKALLEDNRGVSLDEDCQLEELIRASITERYLSSENFLPCDFWRDRNCESNSNVEKRSARKFTNPNFRTAKNKPAIYEKFSTPGRQGEKTKPAALASTTGSPGIPTRKFSDVKVSLKSKNKNLCGDEEKLSVKSSSLKRAPDDTATKYKNRNFLKTESCDKLDSRFISTESSRLLGRKKRGGSKK